MTEPDSSTPRVDALRNARTEDVDLDAERTRNQVANADEVLAANAPQADEIAAQEAVSRLEQDDVVDAGAPSDTIDEDDDLPGSTYRRGATPLVTERLLADQAAPSDAAPTASDDLAETAAMPVASPVAAPATEAALADETVAEAPTLEADDVDIVETEPTELVEEAPKAADAAVATPAIAPLFREPRTTDSVATGAPLVDADTTEGAPVENEAEKTAVIDRDAEREARQKRLGIVAAPAPVDEPVVPVAKPTRTTDKWHGSLGLFLLRLATGALLITQGWAHLSHWTETQEFFANSVLPQPQWFALGVSIAEIVAGVLLVLGLLTRFAGLLLVAIEAILLAFFIYGKSGAIFTPGEPGFKGDIEILFAAIGLLFLLLGGGGLAIDKIFRRNRARAREERLLGNTV